MYRAVAREVNEGAVENDKFSDSQLRSRVVNHEHGRQDKCGNSTNKIENQEEVQNTQLKKRIKYDYEKDDERVSDEFMKAFEGMKGARMHEREVNVRKTRTT